jgi:hypothetical protein
MRRRPLQQETAKGWGELPPHLGLDDPFRPHNMGSSLLAQITPFPHSFPPQHLVLDIVRLYIAFNGSETDQGADQYYVRVTSTTSIVKTSVYLVETIVSDLFIVRLYLPSPFSQCTLYRSGRATSYIGAILYGTRVSPPSFSQSFYISPTSVCPPHRPQRGGTLNASFRDRDRGNLHPVAHRAGCCLRQEARANHKLILRLHSCLECRLHRCVLYCILHFADGEDKSFDIYSLRPALASSGLIAFRIWRTQTQTRDAKMGSNLIKVSVIVIESGAFHISLISLRPTAISHVSGGEQVRSI